MRIVPKHVAEARRAAIAAAKAEAEAKAKREATGREQPIEGQPAPPVVPSPSTCDPVPEAKPKRRGHAVRDENGKYQPTGDYDKGFARAPADRKFQKGGPPGPGRPKGSVSHDTLMKRHLDQKRNVRVDGKAKKLTHREIVIMSDVKDAMEGKPDARKRVLENSARLFGEDKGSKTAGPAELNASDALSLAEVEAELRRQILEELKREDGDDQEEAA